MATDELHIQRSVQAGGAPSTTACYYRWSVYDGMDIPPPAPLMRTTTLRLRSIKTTARTLTCVGFHLFSNFLGLHFPSAWRAQIGSSFQQLQLFTASQPIRMLDSYWLDPPSHKFTTTTPSQMMGKVHDGDLTCRAFRLTLWRCQAKVSAAAGCYANWIENAYFKIKQVVISGDRNIGNNIQLS
jgi:hypothetical protein